MKQIDYHVCQHCSKQYKTAKGLVNHKCKKLLRKVQFKSLIGQQSYRYYKHWLTTQHRYVQDSDSYLSSKFFTQFYNFTKFSKSIGLPEILKFVELMVDWGIQPLLWTSDYAYNAYMNYLDNVLDPLDQVRISLKLLTRLSLAYECKLNQVFAKLGTNKIIELLRGRKLSPWVLMNSNYFQDELKSNRVSPEQRFIILNIIKPKIWKFKFIKYPEETKIIRKLIKKLDL